MKKRRTDLEKAPDLSDKVAFHVRLFRHFFTGAASANNNCRGRPLAIPGNL
jgi:hypothetical protein